MKLNMQLFKAYFIVYNICFIENYDAIFRDLKKHTHKYTIIVTLFNKFIN